MKITPDISRLHAHICGDGALFAYRTSEKDRINRIEIFYYNNNQKLLLSFANDLNQQFSTNCKANLNRKWVKIKSIRIGKIFLGLTPSYKSREWRIPDAIKNSNTVNKIEWIKAFSHDEAYLPPDRNIIRIKCMNQQGLQDIKEMAQSIGINSHITGPNCDASYYLNLKKEGLLQDFIKDKARRNTRFSPIKPTP